MIITLLPLVIADPRGRLGSSREKKGEEKSKRGMEGGRRVLGWICCVSFLFGLNNNNTCLKSK
jgi:hypothetical protein